MSDGADCGHGFPSRLACTECLYDGVPDPAPEKRPTLTAQATFTAQHEGTCATCEFPIPAGQAMTRWSDNRYRHPRCTP